MGRNGLHRHWPILLLRRHTLIDSCRSKERHLSTLFSTLRHAYKLVLVQADGLPVQFELRDHPIKPLTNHLRVNPRSRLTCLKRCIVELALTRPSDSIENFLIALGIMLVQPRLEDLLKFMRQPQ